MVNYYTLNNTITFRVATVEDALALRNELQHNKFGELVNFSYTTKYIKAGGEIIEEYQVVKAKIQFTAEKEPEAKVFINYSDEPMESEDEFDD